MLLSSTRHSILKPAVLLLFLHWSIIPPSGAQTPSDAVRLNQVGFYPAAPKVAVVPGEAQGTFSVLSAEGKTVFSGTLSKPQPDEFSGKITRKADFSGFTKPGAYQLVVPGVGRSYTFEIKPQVHREVAGGALKGFYYQRVSTPLPEAYAGRWSRPAGHPDDKVEVHPSAASDSRPAGTLLASPRGWYDAGDYNKYIVNSGITMGTLFSAYEDYPAFWKSLTVNIPESKNAIPDLLDESLWNLRWMLTMQDPADGGVYHKLTNARFDGMVMPDKATAVRYLVQKSTAAALDFAAVTAQASRIFRPYDAQLPGLADSCLAAAVKAWNWARKNPEVLYVQKEMNNRFDPDIVTGDYGDRSLGDEWIWAAAELYLTTKDETYYRSVNLFPDEKMPLPSWSQVRLLGYYSLLRFEKQLTPLARRDSEGLKQRLIGFANELLHGAADRSFGTVMGRTAADFIWGSSAVAANQGIALLQAYRLTNQPQYARAALSNLDYLLGRNATGYSFVTGFGDKRVMHPHHRPSEADGIAEPVPGLLSGGPNPGRQDGCQYPSVIPNEAFTDNVCSYASNEIAINWNAPLVYLAGAIEATMK